MENSLPPQTEPQHIALSAVIPETLAGQRFDVALATLFPEYSRSRLQQWIKEKSATLDGQPCSPKQSVSLGQTVSIRTTITPEARWAPEAIPLTVVYEDDALLVIDKPPGLVTHPGAGTPSGTLLNGLLHYTPELAKVPRAGIIHRLDKDTSGLLVIARTPTVHTHLVDRLQKREITRIYQAIVQGAMTGGGTVDAPIQRHPTHRTKMAVVPKGKPAVTHYRIIEKFRAHTHIRVQLETGRTHQIRVHMAHIRYPIVGDGTYGGRMIVPKQASEILLKTLQQFKRQALHACHLALQHPLTHEPMEWDSPLPQDMQQLLTELKEDTATHVAMD